MNGKPVNEKRVTQLEDKMVKTLDSIENIWLKGKPYLGGNEISISDIVAICEIDQPSEYTIISVSIKMYFTQFFLFLGMAGFDPFVNRPNLSKWKKRVVSNLSPYYEEVNEMVEKNAAKYNEKHGLQLNSKI